MKTYQFTMSLTFSTRLFSGNYDCVVFSVVDEYIRAIFRDKRYVCLSVLQDISIMKNTLKYTDEEKEYFLKYFSFDGRTPVDRSIADLSGIIESIGKNTKINILNGTDIDVSNWIGEDRVSRNIEMNLAVDRVVLKYPNVSLVDMRKIVVNGNQLIGDDNRHYDSKTYSWQKK